MFFFGYFSNFGICAFVWGGYKFFELEFVFLKCFLCEIGLLKFEYLMWFALYFFFLCV